jgi:formylglycine-generating enzyme required for sulfatase activity
MKTTRLLITLCVFLTAFLFGGIALANDSEIFGAVSSNSTLEAPKLTVEINGNEVLLSWSKVTGANDYIVHYAQYPYDSPDTIKTIDVGDKTSALYYLSPGKAYHVAVKACKDSAADCSDYSIIHDVVIPPVSTFKNSLGQEFKLIPAGTFTMGSPSDELGRQNDEIQHQVTLTQPFYMMTTEVTQNQWRDVMGTLPFHFLGCPDCPVESVSWDDAQSYIAMMNARGEGTYSLPTEAQWEYAARAGSTTAFYNGAITAPWSECVDDAHLSAIGWYCINSLNGPQEVGRKSPNAWGLYDMSGNVWEWCQDWYGSYPSSAVIDPTGPSSGEERVGRGGSWKNWSQQCRSAERYSTAEGFQFSFLGFRLLRQP